jgi:tetratricopeptide (TPR) repeat protein
MRLPTMIKVLPVIGVVLIGIILSACTGPADSTAEWHANRAYELYEQGRYDEAIEECNKAIELDPNMMEAYGNRTVAYKEQGKKTEAIADLETFITLTNSPEWIEMARQLIEELQSQ